MTGWTQTAAPGLLTLRIWVEVRFFFFGVGVSNKGRGYSPNLLQASTGSDVSPRLWARTRSSMQVSLSAGAGTLHSLEEIWTQVGTSLHLSSLELRQNVFLFYYEGEDWTLTSMADMEAAPTSCTEP